MSELICNKIAHYIDEKTKKVLFSEPFADPDNIHHVYERYVGQSYKSYEQYIEEQNNKS